MRKLALLLVALCLVAGMSGAAWANLSVMVTDAQQNPLGAGINVRFWVKTGPNAEDWSYVDDETNAQGIADDGGLLTPHSSATFWYAEIIDSEYEVTQTDDTFYPDTDADLVAIPL